jgi:hypothetical protein
LVETVGLALLRSKQTVDTPSTRRHVHHDRVAVHPLRLEVQVHRHGMVAEHLDKKAGVLLQAFSSATRTTR